MFLLVWKPAEAVGIISNTVLKQRVMADSGEEGRYFSKGADNSLKDYLCEISSSDDEPLERYN